MLTTLNCSMYYSISGNPFLISDRKTAEDIYRTPVILSIDTDKRVQDDQEMLLADYRTSLTLPHPIKSGEFFASDTQCFFINGKNQILKLGGGYRFRVAMYRLLDDPSRLRVIFENKEWTGTPLWVCL